ncbi:MAG: YlbF family regulator [Lachnospiraceae bacterium]|nr:YlbF family regulator [Lachnospiraceae bacterium]MCD7765704.1 YlbF family regulator [Lachnospiraceae bacterium]
MNRVEECTQALIESIQQTEEYLRYQKLRELTDQDPELRRKLNEFRRRVYQVQTSGETLDHYSEQERLGSDASEFRKNELVDEYLKMELHICRMIQNMAFQIADAIDLDLDDVLEGL